MINFYQHSEIDKAKWNRCIASSYCPTIFVDYDFLTIANPTWCALVRNDYEAVMPLPCRSKFGFSYLYTPPFISRLGVFSEKPPRPEEVAAFVKHIPKRFVQVDLNLNAWNSTENAKVKTEMQISHRLHLDRPYKTVYQDYSSRNKRTVKLARRAQTTIDTHVAADEIVALFRNNRGRDANICINEEEYATFLKMAEWAYQRGDLENWGVRDEAGTLLAGACFLHDGNYHWFWFSGRDCKRSEARAMFYLIDEYIVMHANQPITFIMSGSRNENISQVYRGFGGERYTYPMLHFCHNSLLALPIKMFKFLKKNL